MIISGGKITINGNLYEFPRFLYDAFDSFLQPETKAKFSIKSVLSNPSSKIYSQIFNTTDFKVTLTNSFGHTLKIAKQWLIMPVIEDLSEPNYEIFYKNSEELSKLDFSNQDSLCKRQEDLLKFTVPNKEKIDPFKEINKLGLWIIMMCHGGGFSIGIFEGMKLITHKSDKKYLVRKKTGRRQIIKDKLRLSMTSVGAQLRREMEAEHQEHIAKIMNEYKEYFPLASVIFIHAPGINKTFFLTEGKPLKPYLNKIKSILVKTKKANFENVMDVFEKLL